MLLLSGLPRHLRVPARIWAAILAVLPLWPLTVRAQVLDQFIPPGTGGIGVEPGVTVQSRAQTGYESAGVRLGSFVLRPSITESPGYESNVLGTARPRGSAFVRTIGDFALRTDQSDTSLAGGLFVDDTRFTDIARQSFTNWTARLSATHEFGRDAGGVEYVHFNQTQRVIDLDLPQALNQALPYRIDVGRLSYRKAFNQVAVTPMLEVSHFGFDNGTFNDGNVYDQSFRDRILLSPSVLVSYELQPRRNLVAVLRDSQAFYARAPAGLPRRDYTDLSALVGISYELSGKLQVRALAGYELRSFAAAAYRQITAPIAELALVWTPTGLTTLTVSLARHIQDSSDEATVGYTETTAGLRVDHEYLRNVRLQGNVAYHQNAYRDSGTQSLYLFGLSAEYLLNRNISATLGYDFLARQSNGTAARGSVSTVNAISALNGSSVGSEMAGGVLGQPFGSGYTDHRIVLQLKLRL